MERKSIVATACGTCAAYRSGDRDHCDCGAHFGTDPHVVAIAHVAVSNGRVTTRTVCELRGTWSETARQSAIDQARAEGVTVL